MTLKGTGLDSSPKAGWKINPSPDCLLPPPCFLSAIISEHDHVAERSWRCMWRAGTDERDWKARLLKDLYSHFHQIHTVRNQSIYRCMSWMQFLFLVTVKKKRYCGNIYMPCVFINIIFITKMYSILLFCHGKGSSHLEKLKVYSTWREFVYDFFKKKLLFIISSILSEMCCQFISFNVSNLEIKKCAMFWRQFYLILYSFILRVCFFLPWLFKVIDLKQYLHGY